MHPQSTACVPCGRKPTHPVENPSSMSRSSSPARPTEVAPWRRSAVFACVCAPSASLPRRSGIRLWLYLGSQCILCTWCVGVGGHGPCHQSQKPLWCIGNRSFCPCELIVSAVLVDGGRNHNEPTLRSYVNTRHHGHTIAHRYRRMKPKVKSSSGHGCKCCRNSTKSLAQVIQSR